MVNSKTFRFVLKRYACRRPKCLNCRLFATHTQQNASKCATRDLLFSKHTQTDFSKLPFTSTYTQKALDMQPTTKFCSMSNKNNMKNGAAVEEPLPAEFSHWLLKFSDLLSKRLESLWQMADKKYRLFRPKVYRYGFNNISFHQTQFLPGELGELRSMHSTFMSVRFPLKKGDLRQRHTYRLVVNNKNQLLNLKYAAGLHPEDFRPPQSQIQFCHLSRLEDQLLEIREIFEQPSSLWRKQPGYDSLLHFLRIDPQRPSTSSSLSAESNGCESTTKACARVSSLKWNREQREAFKSCMNPEKLFVAVHGPAGSGKLAMIEELVAEMHIDGKRVIVCLRSNVELEDFLRKSDFLGIAQENMIIYGGSKSHSSERQNLFRAHERWTGLQKFFDEINQMESRITPDFRENPKVRDLQSKIFLEFIRMEREILERMQIVVCSSLEAAKICVLGGFHPHVQIVQCGEHIDELYCYKVISRAPRTIVFDDHVEKFSASRFESPDLMEMIHERVFGEADPRCAYHRLLTQYRCNAAIVKWPSQTFYEGKIMTDKPACDRTVADLIHEKAKANQFSADQRTIIQAPLVFVDLDKVEKEWSKFFVDGRLTRAHTRKHSKLFNFGEFLMISSYLLKLIRSGLRHDQICCIALAQTDPFRTLLKAIFMKTDAPIVDPANSVFPNAHSFASARSPRHIIIYNQALSVEPKRLAHHWLSAAMLRARRQFVLVGRRKAFEEHSPETRALLTTFQENGVIVAPQQFSSPEDMLEMNDILRRSAVKNFSIFKL